MDKISSATPTRFWLLRNYLNNKHPFLYFLLACIGSFLMGRKLYRVIRLLLKLYFAKPLNLKHRYGENSWAVVTGASDGIGKALCFELARKGFNICLIARNKQKLEQVALDISKISGEKVKTRIIIADFMQSAEQNFFNKIYSQLEALDVSILVNNVGCAADSYFESLEEDLLREQLLVNCFPIAFMTRKIVPKMLQRSPKKSAIINISSVVGSRPCPYFQIYSATKAFGDFFSRAISLEYEEKIDVLSLKPGQVSTNMTRELKKDFTQISAEECARSCLLRLGHHNQTEGHWIHVIQGNLLKLVSDKKLTSFIKESLHEK